MKRKYSHVLVTETWEDVGFSHDISISLCDNPALELEHLYQNHLQELGLDFTGLNDIEIEELLEEHDVQYEEGEYLLGQDKYCSFRYSIVPLENRVTGKCVAIEVTDIIE